MLASLDIVPCSPRCLCKHSIRCSAPAVAMLLTPWNANPVKSELKQPWLLCCACVQSSGAPDLLHFGTVHEAPPMLTYPALKVFDTTARQEVYHKQRLLRRRLLLLLPPLASQWKCLAVLAAGGGCEGLGRLRSRSLFAPCSQSHRGAMLIERREPHS